MYTKIGIPENNSLKSKIEELYEWCDKRDNDDELGKTYFNELTHLTLKRPIQT